MHANLTRVEAILDRYPKDESSLVMVLQDIQSEFRFLPCEALEEVAERLSLPRSRVFSVSTFYKVFSLEPRGRTVIQVCKGTACHVRGAQMIEDELCRELGLPVGGTSADGDFSLETVNCVGACAMAPVVIAGEEYHGEVNPSGVRRVLRKAARALAAPRAVGTDPSTQESPRFASSAQLLEYSGRAKNKSEGLASRIRVCGGPGCLAAGAQGVQDAISKTAAERGLELAVTLSDCECSGERLLGKTGCQGLCQQGPLVHVAPDDVLYTKAKKADAKEIVEGILSGAVVDRLLGEHAGRVDHPFYSGQKLLALAHCGKIDPESLEDYVARGGFVALAEALARGSAEEVLDQVAASGLRGRGGAGFPTGRKWRSARKAARESGHAPYVVCNGDEGDPGAFMDRVIMEGAPFQVLEGMLLGAFALEASAGYLYVRAEYPLAIERLEHAIAVCRAAGLLGTGILGSSFCFDVRISRGGGAFVCGESTALMRSIEGKVGEPRAKYTRSVERGLYERPTVLNNVETWALVPGIARHGAEWLASIGTEGSKGTKAFSLSGQVERTGLVEVPMGTSLRRLIFEIGGGMRQGRRFKAVQTGGPSGGCLPDSKLDLPIDFEALSEAGSMMGSGGMIVLDQQTCMVDVARYFVDFLLEESCGKCSPCRLGLQQLSHLLGRLTRGESSAGELDSMEEISAGMMTNSLCALGKSAPNPVLSTLRYFREEYEAHLAGSCPAGVCRELIRYEITDDCTGCLLCKKACPGQAISGELEELHVIDQALCDRCGICKAVCAKVNAVRVLTSGDS